MNLFQSFQWFQSFQRFMYAGRFSEISRKGAKALSSE
jgi:hypothetical protein